MEPRYFAGEVVYLHPTRPPNPGDFIFVTVKEPGFPASVGYVRQFLGSDLVSLRVSTLNPKRAQVIPHQDVIGIATVVGSGLFWNAGIDPMVVARALWVGGHSTEAGALPSDAPS